MRALSTWSAIAFAALASSLIAGCHDDDDDAPATAAPVLSTPSPLANGIVGTAIATTNFMANGTAPITYTVSGGLLPPGLTLSSAGALTGTPTVAGTYDFTVTVSNSAGANDTPYRQTILALPVITAPPSPLAAAVGGTPLP